MGLDITYKAGKRELLLRLSTDDIEVCDFLRKKGFEKEINDIIGVAEFGKGCSIESSTLLESVAGLAKVVTSDTGLMPCVYGLKQEFPRSSGKYSNGSGSISGVKINGEVCAIECGLDYCNLFKLKRDKTGKLHYDFDSPIDIRNEKVLPVDRDKKCKLEFGNILVYRHAKTHSLVEYLGTLKAFLDRIRANVVDKIVG